MIDGAQFGAAACIHTCLIVTCLVRLCPAGDDTPLSIIPTATITTSPTSAIPPASTPPASTSHPQPDLRPVSPTSHPLLEDHTPITAVADAAPSHQLLPVQPGTQQQLSGYDDYSYWPDLSCLE